MHSPRVDTNEHGQLVGCGFHDAGVVGFSYEEGKDLILTVRRLDGRVVRLVVVAVGPFGFRGFRNGAIISDVFAWAPESVPPAEIASEQGAWAVLFGNDIPIRDLPSAVEPLLKRGFTYLVSVESSYGGSIAALCKGVRVEEAT